MRKRLESNNHKAFFALLRAGLWEQDVKLLSYKTLDLSVVYSLAQEQTVVGIVASGLEHVSDTRLHKDSVLLFVGDALQMEQRNTAMNNLISVLVDKLKDAGVNILLVKGQGIAQCYARPLWRSCGDVDFLVDDNHYERAKQVLLELSEVKAVEVDNRKHLELNIQGWVVELHGSLRGYVLGRIDKGIDNILTDIFSKNKVRVWQNGSTPVYLPAPDEDVVLVFAHILQHFTQGGIGLRQVCDWCRLLWVYRDTLDYELLESRIRGMGIMTEWKAFGSLAVDFLGMPNKDMPFYSSDNKWNRKANRLMEFILMTGNMGHNRDFSYSERHSYLISKFISLWWHTTDALEHFRIFPLDSIMIWGNLVTRRSKVALKGE